MTWLLYGAYGYTGELIAREAAGRGLRPILAGRDEQKVRRLADELQLPWRAFALDDPEAIVKQLAGCETVLHCAGPFSQTARPMMEACLAAGAHYLDITGEIDVIEAAAALHERAKDAGVVLLPAVGFDVVPTDCLAAILADKLPSATRLALAFSTSLQASPGTAKTIVEGLPQGGRVRRAGRIERVPLAYKSRQIPFADKPRWAMTIPWGDVASAYYSTGIGNIEVYLATRQWKINFIRATRWLMPLARLSVVQSMWKNHITRNEKGPSAADRRQQQCFLWGEVTDDDGNSAQATMTTPNGYALTVQTSLAAVERLTWGRSPDLPVNKSSSGRPGGPPYVPPGFHTPSTAFGKDFILEFNGVQLEPPRDYEIHRPQRSAG